MIRFLLVNLLGRYRAPRMVEGRRYIIVNGYPPFTQLAVSNALCLTVTGTYAYLIDEAVYTGADNTIVVERATGYAIAVRGMKPTAATRAVDPSTRESINEN